MAGFIAPVTSWNDLEPALDQVLIKYKVPILHAKEFHDTKPPFAGWNKVKKRSFVEELFSLTQGRIYGLSVTVRRSDYAKAQMKMLGLADMSPIGVRFSAILTKVITDESIFRAVKNDGVSFLVERGNKNNGGIENFFLKMSKEATFEGALRSISFITKESCRAVQLADFFAFYSRRLMRNHDRFPDNFVLPACPYLQIMQKHGPIWQQRTRGSISQAGHLDHLPNLESLRALTSK